MASALNGYDRQSAPAGKSLDPRAAASRPGLPASPAPRRNFACHTARRRGCDHGLPKTRRLAAYTQCFPDALHQPDWVQPGSSAGRRRPSGRPASTASGGFLKTEEQTGGCLLRRNQGCLLEFACVLSVSGWRQDLLSGTGDSIVTWCVSISSR